MNYRLLGRSGLRVSEVSLGTMTFGEDWGWGSARDEARKIYDAYRAAGGNFIDTANVYTNGASERMVGEFTQGHRAEVVIATKYTNAMPGNDVNAGGNQRKNMMQSVEASLKRLNTDYIDLYWLHIWDQLTPVEEVMRAFDDLVRQGKVLYAGISDAPAWWVAQANTLATLRGWSPFVGLQIEYSLIERTIERELIPMAKAFGLGLVAWSPLSGGILTGKYSGGQTNAEARYSADMMKGFMPAEDRPARIIPVLKKISEDTGRSLAQVALAWLRYRDIPVIPILGARKLQQFEDNLASLTLHLTPEQVKAFRRIEFHRAGLPARVLRNGHGESAHLRRHARSHSDLSADSAIKSRMPASILLILTALIPLAAAARTVTDAEVEKVHRSAILIDTHNDVTSATVDGLDIGKLRAKGHTDVVRMKQGGMGAQFFAVYVAASYAKDKTAAHRTLDMIDTVRHDIIEAHPNDFYFATTADGILEAHRQHKIAALMGIEGGHAIEDDLRLLRDFYALGVRYMTLTHSNSNDWADSSGDENKPHNGLTPFGKDVVREMNRLGMIVDIAHVADKTFWDALETSAAPIFSSHSSCRALSNVPRNMTDEMIAALGKKGGVVQINFSCGFLSQKSADSEAKSDRKALTRELEAMREKYKDNPAALREAQENYYAARGKNTVRATLADVVANIDHVVKIAGVDHVGLGQRLRWCRLRARGPRRCFEMAEPDARAARKGLLGGGHPQDLRRQHAAPDARG